MILVVFSCHFLSKSIKPHFWPHFRDFWMIRIFREKSGSVTFFHLSSSNFMPKIRKIVGAVFQKKCRQTNRLTDRPTIPALSSPPGGENCKVTTVTCLTSRLTKVDFNILKNLKKLKKSKIVWFIKFYQLNKFNRYD